MSHPPPRSSGSARSLWLWVIVAFLVLLAAWSALILVAMKHKPQTIEVEPQER